MEEQLHYTLCLWQMTLPTNAATLETKLQQISPLGPNHIQPKNQGVNLDAMYSRKFPLKSGSFILFFTKCTTSHPMFRTFQMAIKYFPILHISLVVLFCLLVLFHFKDIYIYIYICWGMYGIFSNFYFIPISINRGSFNHSYYCILLEVQSYKWHV